MKIRLLRIALPALLALFVQLTAVADEGMWLPLHIERLNYADMQEKGLQLTPEEIYSVNNSSLKDAIASLGGFCTAEMISGEGLMLTNHHCAFGSIQEHSSVENDYLTDGFWAMSKDEELPVQGLTASFLVRMEDVTAAILPRLNEEMSEAERSAVARELSDSLVKKAEEGTHYNARVKSFFNGNEYYLFIYETFRDVRIAGAPPTSIGKFGGDTDNWMWPRHTGDFALLRVYANKDNEPADYSQENVPYQPKHFLPVSLDGVKESDFTMVMGYPGRTDRYLTSHGVKFAIEKEQPSIVRIREKRLEAMKKDMDKSDEVRIKYASKYAQVSNYYKYFKGQTKGLKRLNIYGKKKAQEDAFARWINEDQKRKEKYGEVLPLFEDVYSQIGKHRMVQVYLNEAVFGPEILLFAYRNSVLYKLLEDPDKNAERIKQTIPALKQRASAHFKDYNAATDEKVFARLLEIYNEDIPEDMQPEVFRDYVKKFKGDFDEFAAYVFKKSFLASQEEFVDFLEKPKQKKMEKDPAFALFRAFLDAYQKGSRTKMDELDEKLSKAERLFIAGLREMKADKKFYPDANFTMRISYGQVLDYYPRDAVYYNFYTTLEGVMEKEDPNNPEFVVPEKLKALYEKKDYGVYGDSVMHVGFISNNDITGGNSGSPVINGKGELIGCAFDGNWEAMSGDIAFEPELQRTISVDIRYILFIIDKFAGAGHLVEEMKLVKTPAPSKEEAKAGSGEPEKLQMN